MEKKKFTAFIDTKTFEDLNSEFKKAKCYILYADQNRNGSDLPKEVVEAAFPSLYNIPIVGEFKETVEDFGTHGGKIEISDEGIKYVQTTKPYGLLPESCNPRWENVKQEDGTEKEYLVADAILWYGRYPELQTTIDSFSNQSMEINVFDAEVTDDGTYKIKQFEFSALCLLGREVEPCFEQAKIVAYGLDEFKAGLDELIKNYKQFVYEETFLSKDEIGSGDTITADLSKEVADMDTAWGSVDKTALRNAILKASNYKSLVGKAYLAVLDGWEDSPSENLKYPVCMIKGGKLVLSANGCQAAYSRLEQNTSADYYASAKRKLKKYYKILGLDTSNFSAEDDELMFSATYQQKYEALENALDPIVVRDSEDNLISETYFYVQDFDDKFVMVYRSIWTINDHQRNAGRFTYSFDDVSVVARITGEFEKMIDNVWLTEAENQRIQDERNQQNQAYQALQTENELLKSQITELQAYKQANEFEQDKAEIVSTIESFESELSESEEFVELKKKINDAFEKKEILITSANLEKELYSMIGRKKFTVQKPKKLISRVAIIDNKKSNEKPEFGEENEKYFSKI